MRAGFISYSSDIAIKFAVPTSDGGRGITACQMRMVGHAWYTQYRWTRARNRIRLEKKTIPLLRCSAWMRLKRTAISVEAESRRSFRAGSREQLGRLRGETNRIWPIAIAFDGLNRGMRNVLWALEIHLHGKDTWDIDAALASEHEKHQGGVVEYYGHQRSRHIWQTFPRLILFCWTVSALPYAPWVLSIATIRYLASVE